MVFHVMKLQTTNHGDRGIMSQPINNDTANGSTSQP